MSGPSALGRIVWHDLFTSDLAAARAFYAAVLGVEYDVEHASHFVWGGGEGDYHLIKAHGDAHGGMVPMRASFNSRWNAYIAVEDVDETTACARKLGFKIARGSFDIPGVGRSSIIEDASGAQISPFAAYHSYPPPKGLFVWDRLITPHAESMAALYSSVFDWRAGKNSVAPGDQIFRDAHDVPIADVKKGASGRTCHAAWYPHIKVADLGAALERALSLGADRLSQAGDLDWGDGVVVLADPTGAVFGLTDASPNDC